MLQSYIITNSANLKQLENIVKKNSDLDFDIFNIGTFEIAIEQQLNYPTQIVKYGSNKYIFTGDIYNKYDIYKMLENISNKSVSLLNNTELFLEIFYIFGDKALYLVDGPFAFICYSQNSIKIYTNPIPNCPLYYIHHNDNCYITNEIKFLRGNNNINLEVKKFSAFQPNAGLPANFTIFRYINKIPSESVLTCLCNLSGYPISTRIDSYKNAFIEKKVNLTLKKSIAYLDYLLFTITSNYLALSEEKPMKVSIALSGGIDSCLVSAYARRIAPESQLYTITFGTEQINEFYYSELCAQHIKAIHNNIIIDDKMFFEGLIKTIYFNEIFDGVFAEVHATMGFVYEIAKKFSSIILTGFYADNLFGGLIPLETPQSRINPILLDKSVRTKWTGEYNVFLAKHYGLRECSPFLNPTLSEWAMSLSSEFKIYNKEVKFILKSLAETQLLLNEKNIWRKKVRLEEGSASEKIFCQFLNLNLGEYYLKHKFTYNIFKLIFEKNIPYQEIDIYSIKKQLNH